MRTFKVKYATCRRNGVAFVIRGDWSGAKHCPICRHELDANHLIYDDMLVEAKSLVEAQDFVDKQLKAPSKGRHYRS